MDYSVKKYSEIDSAPTLWYNFSRSGVFKVRYNDAYKYGSGFYLTTDPIKYADRGGIMTMWEISPNANVLVVDKNTSKELGLFQADVHFNHGGWNGLFDKYQIDALMVPQPGTTNQYELVVRTGEIVNQVHERVIEKLSTKIRNDRT